MRQDIKVLTSLPLQIVDISHNQSSLIPTVQLQTVQVACGLPATQLFMGKRGKLGDAVEPLSAMNSKVQLLAHLHA